MSPGALRALADDLLAWMKSPARTCMQVVWASELRRKIDERLA